MIVEAWASFSAPYRVRFDEAAADGLLRTSGLLRYAQDLAWMHSVARGFDRRWYRERGLNWVVRAVDLGVAGSIPLGVTLEATTEVVGQRRVWARRLGTFRLDGACVARVQTDWLLLDTANRPTRLPLEFEGAFAPLSAREPLGRVDLPVAPPETPRSVIRVRPQELDPMRHVNNAVYLDWFEECVARWEPEAKDIGSIPRRVRMEYLGSAEPGAELVATTWRDGDGWDFLLETRTGQPVVKAALRSG
jgi:acyl-ACP thioesterase